MKCIFKTGPVEIWSVPETWGTDFYVYGVTTGGDPRICPSLGMAREVVAESLPREASFLLLDAVLVMAARDSLQ